MPHYQIRPAAPKDASQIAELHVAVWNAAYENILPAGFLAQMTVQKRLAFWREAVEFGEPQLLLAFQEESKLVGFVGFDRSRDKGSKSTTGEIWALYVLPAYWRQGAGLALWDSAREGLKEEGCSQVTAWTLLNNHRALAFFEQGAGFKREISTLRTTAFGSARLEEIRLKRSLD